MTDTVRLLSAGLAGGILTFLFLYFLPFGKFLLGHDRGRKFAAGSEVNIGKPTGVGIYFMLAFVLSCAAFAVPDTGLYIILALTYLMSFIGFLDDRSASPWGEYSKGALDIVVSLIGSLAFVRYFGSSVHLSFTDNNIILNPVVYLILATVLFIVSINATNATDGVDGLSGTLSILTAATLMAAGALKGTMRIEDAIPGFAFILVLIPYLFFNRYPSKMLMGDAGSRGIGFFIAFYFMYLRLPFSYLIVGLPFLIDGGLSILKITVGRLTRKKIIILRNLITPVHDHLKKKKGFSVPKTRWVICGIAAIIDIIYLIIILITDIR